MLSNPNPFVITPDDPNAGSNAFVSIAKAAPIFEDKPIFDAHSKTTLIVDTNVLPK